jgi:hypothetical protein
MNKASNIVSSSIVREDKKTIFINGKAYIIKSPTIHNMAGAISCLSKMDFKEGDTFRDVFINNKDCVQYAKALSWFIEGDAGLSEELEKGTFEDVIEGLESAFELLSPDFFWKAASLTKSACNLAASQK